MTVPPERRKVVRRVAVGGAAVAVAAAAAIGAIVIPHDATAVQPTPTPATTTISPSTTPTTGPTTTPRAQKALPQSFQGTWQGTVTYDPGATDDLRLEVGQTAMTEHYVQYRCTATSRLTVVKGDTATLERATMKGNCPRNGSITLELDPAAQTLVFRYTGHGENDVTRNTRFTMYALLER